MKNNRTKTAAFLLLSLSLLISCSKNNDEPNPQSTSKQSPVNTQSDLKDGKINVTVSVFASGIPFPRGLAFGPGGYLYVSQAGFGGTDSTTGLCAQVIPPVGPYKGGNNASISKISPLGSVSTVATNMPSCISPEGVTMGVSDVEFIGDDLYALVVAGCSHGHPEYPSSIVKVNEGDGTWSLVADLSTYWQTHPVAAPSADDFEPDGTPYSMINVEGSLYVIEPNHGEMDKVTTNGFITRVIDFSAIYGHIVPTSVANHGNFYVGNLRTFPLVGGSSDIYKVTPSGQSKIWATGFTGITGVAFDKHHRLYVLEMSQDGGPTPGTGRVVRVGENGRKQVIVDNLTFPTGMTFGPDGDLFISDVGFGPPTGQILRVHFNHGDDGDNSVGVGDAQVDSGN